MDDLAIKVDFVHKAFKLPHEKQSSMKHRFVNMFRGKSTFEHQQVLKDVSLEVKKGEFFGIVGRNGSGKSTLLKLLSGIYSPDKGRILVNGSLTPFIELGVGFNPELSGRDNVFLNGALFGFSRKAMSAMYDDIVAFAELERFMDQKLKNYSSGMQVRLAFAIAIKANSDILLLDEVLAVGDAAFQKKCFNYFRGLKKAKRTVVFVSHDMNAVREYCDRAVLLEKGQIIAEGKADAVAKQYTKLFMEEDKAKPVLGGQKRISTGEAQIEKVDVSQNDTEVNITVSYHFNKTVETPIFGLTIVNPIGIKVFESNTKWKKIKTDNYKAGDKVKVDWEIPNFFTNGSITILSIK